MIGTFALQTLLGWRPLLDPIDAHGPWQAIALLPPMVLAIALIYKALKLPTLAGLASETLQLTGYILALMATSAAVFWLLVELVA